MLQISRLLHAFDNLVKSLNLSVIGDVSICLIMNYKTSCCSAIIRLVLQVWLDWILKF